MRNKNARRYSYNNHDSRNSKFINKDFNKTESYKTNFSGALFQNTSFVGAKFKWCAFYGSIFDNCFIRGSLFRGCNLITATMKSSIISATVFDCCKLNDCVFEKCKIISTPRLEKSLLKFSLRETVIFNDYPLESTFNSALIKTVEELRANAFVRQSTVLHRKKGKIDTISLTVLLDIFGEDFLIHYLDKIPGYIDKSFHTLSYLIRILQKMRDCPRDEVPGPTALGVPKLTDECSSTD